MQNWLINYTYIFISTIIRINSSTSLLLFYSAFATTFELFLRKISSINLLHGSCIRIWPFL